MRGEFGVNKQDAEKDLKRIEVEMASNVEREFGVLSEEETALISPMRDYVRDFAIINTGGKGVVMNLHQPDLSKSIMPRDDFEFLYRKDWFEVATEAGIKTIYPAKCFLAKPPKAAQVYLDGFVFRPKGTVRASEYNLYQGMLVEPDPSGSCSLLHDLIREVWAQGDEQSAQWVIEFLMHIIAHPGEKVGTSIAIRGGYGDGKSIVCEKMMSTILGDMVLRVANHRMILGDFNEALIGKLATVLEEAAFAGDKSAFDKMKELITGDKVLINPKYKAPITVDNYSRLFVISNHDHFLHIKPGDRRYTVLESSPVWKGTTKFEQLLDQWENGGAARFVYDALNHSFRQFDDRKRLVINTNLKTTAAVRQMAQSRSSLEKCIVGLLLRGDFRSIKTGETLLIRADGELAEAAGIWGLDKRLCSPCYKMMSETEKTIPMAQQKQVSKRVWLYARFSTEAQGEGTSLDVQRLQLKAICAEESLKPTGFVIDKATSGAKPLADREHGGRMLARLKKGDVVVGLKLDRMFRSAADCLTTAAELHKRGVRLFLRDLGGWISGTPEAEFRLTIFAGVAQFERRRIATRIRESKAYLRTRNRFEGGDVPFGYRKVDSPIGERTRRDTPVYYIEPDPEIHSVAGDLLRRCYSSRLARGEFVARGYNVSHVAVAKLFRKLRIGCAT